MSTSAEALAWAWRQTMPTTGENKIPPTGKYLLVTIAGETHRIDGGPYCAAPGMAKLVSLTGLNESTIVRLIKQLISAGFMTRERGRPAENGYRTKDVYTLPVSVATSVAKPAKLADSKLAPRKSGNQTGMTQDCTTPSIQTSPEADATGQPCTTQAWMVQEQVLTTKRESKTKNSPSNPAAEKPPTSTNDPRFIEFWAACPRKVGKADAFRKYALAIRKGTPSATLLAGMHRYAQGVKDTDPQFVAHPATWLYQGRWEDEQPAARAGGSSEPTQIRRWPGWEHGAPRPQGWRAS